MSKLHINIVTLNNLSYLKDAINSIRTKHDYKLRVIDQDGNDGTQEWCRTQGIDCHKFQPRVSLSEAWNYGFREALKDDECGYILFPNDDILFHPTTIDNLVEASDSLGYALVTGSNVAHEMSIEALMAKEEMGDWDFDVRPITNWREEGPDFSCPMITPDTIKKIGYFDENYAPAYKEDWDYHTRIVKSGYHAKRITKAPYYHFGSMTSRNNPTLGITSGAVDRIHLEKWGSLDHGAILDSNAGYAVPYNNVPSYRYWRGCEKYE